MTLRDQQKKVTERLTDIRNTIQTNIREIVDKSAVGKNVEKQIQNIQKNMEKAINLAFLGMNIATRDQIKYLDKKIDMVNSKVDSMGPKKANKKKKATKKARQAVAQL